MQFAIDSEFFAVRYTMWDHAQQRFEQGQINRAALLALDAEHQTTRARRDASQQRMRSTRQKLAHAIARPGSVLTDLAEPELKNSARPLPEYEAMLAWVMRHNPRVLSLRAQLAAADARLAAVRAERNPALEAEVQGGRYSRPSSTRDEVSAGLIFTIPLYQGGRVDAREARERANRERSLAELEKLAYDLADALLATLQEIEWLRDSSAAAADRQIAYRDSALERARAEYELELQSNLGDSLAETQVAALRRRQVDYQWALAWARLEGLSGGVLPPVERTQE
jgi:outer membrane protein TolC